MNKKSLHGKAGEELTAYYLQKSGYSVIRRNCHIGHAEIDIIAVKDDIIAFVEVKTRMTSSYEEAPYALGKAQKERIRAAAERFMLENEIDLQPRFDTALVTLRGDRPIHFDYYDNDF
ncbi:MAG: YraN family protein [Oscillospiraceae bacterium]|nr:YraN family protein [Oscillospiraceae bacterium]